MVVIHEKLPSEQHFLRDWVWSCIAGKSLDFLIRETGDASPAHIYIVSYYDREDFRVECGCCSVDLLEPTYVDISPTRDVPML